MILVKLNAKADLAALIVSVYKIFNQFAEIIQKKELNNAMALVKLNVKMVLAVIIVLALKMYNNQFAATI